MDKTLPPISEVGDMKWPQDSSNDVENEIVKTVSSPSESSWIGTTTMARRPSGVSPYSTGPEVPLDGSAAPTMINSASSTCTDSWSPVVDRDEAEADVNWEQDSDDVLTIPKLEPIEDEVNLGDFKPAPIVSPAILDPQAKHKRPRGRPRKHPPGATANQNKITKGRSKTGCITCRKRKKKCDEAKPRCLNCEKNAVVCEGYHEKQVWKSGKEKAEEERLRRESLPSITIQPIFHGVETAEDKIFWKHYIKHFSNILTVEGEATNAFKDIILPLANQHQGLMHSILAVSSKHLDLDAPYGSKILQDSPIVTRASLQQRSDYHHDEAMRRLYVDMEKTLDKEDPEYSTILCARYGQMLCLLLQTRAEGNPRGEHRLHLQAYKSLIQHSPPDDTTFHTFITEFFQYHIFADDLFWLPETGAQRLASEDWEPAIPIRPARLIGVADGLFHYLPAITTIRNRVRVHLDAGIEPVVDYNSLYRAAEIDAAIRNWTPIWQSGDSRERVGLLYKQMMWIHLFRTIYPPGSPSSSRRQTFSTLPAMDPPAVVQRRASMTGTINCSSPVALIDPLHASPQPVSLSCPSWRNPSRANSTHEKDLLQGSAAPDISDVPQTSPAPHRKPAQHDRRVTLAVDESLSILESFQPSEPTQTLLLIPCMVIGATCFGNAQQNRVRAILKGISGYTGLENCDRVSEILQEVWSLMEKGQWIAAWDWQRVSRRMGLDFLCA